MKMEGVLKLFFGESNIPTPEYIKRAATKALEEGYTFYTENAGLPGLRQDLADYYRRLQGVELDPQSEIVVTGSGVQALNVGIRCILNPGDEALVLTPSWPNHSAKVRMDNAVPVEVPLLLRDERYVIDFDGLEAALTPRTRLLIYTSPQIRSAGWLRKMNRNNSWNLPGATTFGCSPMKSMSGSTIKAWDSEILRPPSCARRAATML